MPLSIVHDSQWAIERGRCSQIDLQATKIGPGPIFGRDDATEGNIPR
jgi:hypothetical protein